MTLAVSGDEYNTGASGPTRGAAMGAARGDRRRSASGGGLQVDGPAPPAATAGVTPGGRNLRDACRSTLTPFDY
jgi:hypothetical protein